jgi:hypothetical protein
MFPPILAWRTPESKPAALGNNLFHVRQRSPLGSGDLPQQSRLLARAGVLALVGASGEAYFQDLRPGLCWSRKRQQEFFPDIHQEIAMRAALLISLGSGVLIAGLAALGVRASAAEPSTAEKVYELRIYKTNPGKLDALHARFRDHTCRLFKKHGIELVGFWTPVDGEEALYYLVAFPSVEAQKNAWQAFRDDPEWKTAKADSEKDGVLVKEVQSKNMKATDYSPIR